MTITTPEPVITTPPFKEEATTYTAYWADSTRSLLHREDGPAVIYKDGAGQSWRGTEQWFYNNRLHRLDGPAVVRSDVSRQAGGQDEWWIHGNKFGTEQEWLACIQKNGLGVVGKPVELEL